MIRTLYNYSAIVVSCITIFTFAISSPSEEMRSFHGDQALVDKELRLRFFLVVGQLVIHSKFLIPARRDPKYAQFLPRRLFYPALMVCNFAIVYFILGIASFIIYSSVLWSYGCKILL